MQKFEVLATEAFKQREVRQPKIVSLGVRLENNLLNVDFGDLDFDISELSHILDQYKLKKKYYRLKDGTFLHLQESGDLEFINGVALFTLKDGENKLILNLPAGMNYTVEETDSQGYTIVSEGEIGSVEPDETVYVKFKNIGEDEPEPEEPTPDEPEPEKPDDAEEYNDEKPEPKDESKNPKTSDEIIINFVSLAMSLGIVLALIKHTSKNKRNTSKYIIW
jgi:hypothetical protein